MSDAFPILPRPTLGRYKQIAKAFQNACNSSNRTATRDWAAEWLEQLARLQSLKITNEVRQQIAGLAIRIEGHWYKFAKLQERPRPCKLVHAQRFIARGHGFANWPKFAKHLQAISRPHSPVANFESAVDAIVAGNLTRLRKLLRANPKLVRARSTREHRSTLLHYVSANGVEDFRQKTPMNIVEVTRLLLESGADVNAESDAYGGRSTTLGLTATSWHPENAGLQLPLMELLLDHGALIEGPDGGSAVNGCLHNGRGQAAEFFASRGARLDLEGAAGVGRLDLVRSNFKPDGTLKPPATQTQMNDGFAWACEFGRTSVVKFLLQRGVKVDTRLKHNGQAGLHWASLGGHADTVKLLLKHNSPIDAKDESYDGTALNWALYGWGNATGREAESRGYYEVVAALIREGATFDLPWYEADGDRRNALKKLRSDPRMKSALRGKLRR